MDYNVVMQIFRYIAFIWEDYEKEQNREHKGISKINKLQRAAEFAEQVKERKMGELFANFETYDVQATRAEERKRTIEEAIEKLIKVLRNLNVEEEIIKAQLKEQYNLTEEETAQKVALYK